MFNLLFPFFSKFTANTAGNVKAFVRKTKMQAVCWALVGAALFFALLFACLALFFLMTRFMPPLQAAVILTLIWLLVAFAGVIFLKISLSRQKSRQQAAASAEQKKLLAGTAVAAMPALLAIGVKSYKTIGVLAGLAVGGAAAYGLWHSKDREEADKPPEQ